MDYRSVKSLPADTVATPQNKGVLIITGGSSFGGSLYLYNMDGTTYSFPSGSTILVNAREGYIVGFNVAGWTGDVNAQVYELF